MIDMAGKQIIPAVIRYTTQLAVHFRGEKCLPGGRREHTDRAFAGILRPSG